MLLFVTIESYNLKKRSFFMPPIQPAVTPVPALEQRHRDPQQSHGSFPPLATRRPLPHRPQLPVPQRPTDLTRPFVLGYVNGQRPVQLPAPLPAQAPTQSSRRGDDPILHPTGLLEISNHCTLYVTKEQLLRPIPRKP